MKYTGILAALAALQLAKTVVATPPACFLSCISEVSRTCAQNHHDVSCICEKHLDVVGCLVDICPYGTFESARDHLWGTCLEHEQHTTPVPPPYHSPTDESDAPYEEPVPHPDPDYEEPVPYPNPGYEEPVPYPNPGYEEPNPDYEEPDYPQEPHPVEPAPYPEVPSYPDDTIEDSDCDDEDDDGDDSDCDDDKNDDRHIVEDDSDCEWEEEETIGPNGEVNIIRRPIKVSDKHKKQPTVEPVRKKIIIKRPIKDRKNVELAGTYANVDRYFE